MAGSALLDMINATPEERAALSKIAMLRAQGIPDDQIYAGLGDPSFTQGGGYGYIDPALQAAGLTSSYNLGRGNLALQAASDEYQRQGNPYNVVSSLQNMRDTGNSAILSDPMLSNVETGPAGIYQQYMQSLFNPSTFPQASAAAGGVAAPGQTPAQPSAVNPTGQSWIDAWRAYNPGKPDPVAGYPAATAPAAGTQTAQQGAARLMGSSFGLGTNTSQYRDTLNSGGVPGFSSLNARDASLMSDDQSKNWMGLVGSTGRVSDPEAAYRKFTSIYGHR